MEGCGTEGEDATGTVSILSNGIAHTPGPDGPVGGQEQKEE